MENKGFSVYVFSQYFQSPIWILTIALVITKFKYLTFEPLGGVKEGGVKLWRCHAYLQALGNHGL